MLYFRVKPESDQVRVKKDFLIANELKTLTELGNIDISIDFVNKHFDKVTISKNKTYWMFGARFESKLNQL